MLPKLQYISQGEDPYDHLKNILQALEGGARWIQLRMKNISPQAYAHFAAYAADMCRDHKATFIVNDNVEVALKCNADGVHLGLNDMPVKEARKILGHQKIIGGTANTLEDVLQRVAEKADYIGLGPLRFTATKEKLSPRLGVEGYQAITEKLRAQHLTIPLYAIGGITLEDINALLEAGVHGVAVSGLVTHAANKKEMIEMIQQKFSYAEHIR